ncbi:MAG: hypothetical protein ACKOCN_03660, partial [Planctomycetaceae bacterium]
STGAPRPLSEDMRKGREPLRTFGDLKQFLQEKSQPEVTDVGDQGDAAAGRLTRGARRDRDPQAGTDGRREPPPIIDETLGTNLEDGSARQSIPRTVDGSEGPGDEKSSPHPTDTSQGTTSDSEHGVERSDSSDPKDSE